MTDADPSREILRHLLDGMLNEGYYRHRANRAAAADRMIRIFVGVLATGAVVTWATSLSGWAGYAWRAMSLAGAALSVSGPILGLSERARQWSDLAAKWTALAGRLRALDLSREANDLRHARMLELLAEAEALQVQDTSRRDDRLTRRLQNELKAQHERRLRVLPA